MQADPPCFSLPLRRAVRRSGHDPRDRPESLYSLTLARYRCHCHCGALDAINHPHAISSQTIRHAHRNTVSEQKTRNLPSPQSIDAEFGLRRCPSRSTILNQDVSGRYDVPGRGWRWRRWWIRCRMAASRVLRVRKSQCSIYPTDLTARTLTCGKPQRKWVPT